MRNLHYGKRDAAAAAQRSDSALFGFRLFPHPSGNTGQPGTVPDSRHLGDHLRRRAGILCPLRENRPVGLADRQYPAAPGRVSAKPGNERRDADHRSGRRAGRLPARLSDQPVYPETHRSAHQHHAGCGKRQCGGALRAVGGGRNRSADGRVQPDDGSGGHVDGRAGGIRTSDQEPGAESPSGSNQPAFSI